MSSVPVYQHVTKRASDACASLRLHACYQNTEQTMHERFKTTVYRRLTRRRKGRVKGGVLKGAC